MPEYTKTEVEQVLKSVIEGLGKINRDTEYTYYASLYPKGYSESILAEKAIEYPELHPLLVQLAEAITYAPGNLWEDSEYQAGSFVTRELALHDKKYCELFADCLSNQDLSHEVYQNEYIDDIMRQWGLCDETALILLARRDDPGQMGPELMSELEQEYGEALKEALEKAEAYYNGGWTGGEGLEDEDDEDWDDEDDEDDEWADDDAHGAGHSMAVQDKVTLDSLQIFWEEEYPKLVVTLPVVPPETHVFEYPSCEALEAATADLAARSRALGYALKQERQLPMAKALAQQAGKAEKPGDILDFFAPVDGQTRVDKMTAKAYAGKPTLPCKKVQLYKDVHEFILFFADPAGCRIYTPNIYDGQYLWSYASETEMYEGLEKRKQEYLAKGYELVLEEAVDYPFEYSLKMTKSMVG